jgi:hypothetical protein
MNRNNKKDKKKTSGKDILIIILSVICLLLLAGILYLARKNEKDISEKLTRESLSNEITVGSTVRDLSDYIMFSEACADKWVEIYNYGVDKVDISGMKLIISGEEKVVIPDNTVLGKGEYYTLDLDVNPGASDINIFNLVSSEGKDVIHKIIPKLKAGESYGVANAENYDMGFMKPSKGTANTSEGIIYEKIAGIGFSVPTGFYDSGFNLTLTAGDGEKIYYTTDGSEPTKESQEYTEPIAVKSLSGGNPVYAVLGFGRAVGTVGYVPASVDKGMVVNAIRVSKNGVITGRATQEYYIGLRKDVSYENIPVLSLTADPDDLFGYFNGIYVPGKGKDDALIQGKTGGANYFNKMEKDAKLSYFEPSKGMTLETSAKVRMHFNGDIAKEQKAFEFTCKNVDKYSDSSLYDYIDSDGNFVIEQFLDDDSYKVRALIANAMMEASKVGTADLSPVILFVEGEYWGVYLMQAPYDSRYIERHYGVKNEKLIFRTYLGTYNSEFMDFYNFVVNNDMSLSENYSQVKSRMDIESYLEYICGNMFFGNSNFKSTKTTVWRTEKTVGLGKTDGKWRWLMSLAPDSLANTAVQNYPVNTFLQQGIQLDPFFQSLLMNREFCNQMKAVMNHMITEQFTEEKCLEVVEKYTDLMKRPAMDTYTRFYGSMSNNLYDDEIEKILSFFSHRGEYITVYTEELAQKGGDLQHIADAEEERLALEKKEREELGLTDEASESDSQEDDANLESSSQEKPNGNEGEKNGQ